MARQAGRKVSIGYGGRTYVGAYVVVGADVRVDCPEGSKEGPLRGAEANPESVAQVLLREIVHASGFAGAVVPPR